MSKLKQVRISRKMKQAEIARLLKITRAAVCYLEKRGIHNATSATRYAEVLHCHPADLMEFAPSEDFSKKNSDKEQTTNVSFI